jgi:nucleoid-associated protein YgaU
VLAGCVFLGLGVGVGIGLRGGSFSTGQPTNGTARPTIVVVAPAASPSPVARATVASTLPSSATSASSSSSTAAVAGEYVVEDGDTMRDIAQKVYGDADQWQRIYDANRDLIGPDPDALQVGTHLHIPPADAN